MILGITEIKGIMELVYLGIGILTAGIPLGIMLFKLFKNKSAKEIWETIRIMIEAAVVEAEKSGKTGAAKKQMVIDAVTAACASQGIDITAFVSQIDAYIENCVKFMNDTK